MGRSYPPARMADETLEESEQHDWRLEADLQPGQSLNDLLERLRGHSQIGPAMPEDVVLTHDGQRLFAYAATRQDSDAAKHALEAALTRDGLAASVLSSHWDPQYDRWLQIDPPLSDAEKQREDAAEHAEDVEETRTLVVSSAKPIRAEVEQTMREWADKLGLECKIFEHPHLLTTQVGFTVTGPKHRIDEFASGLRAETRATVRAETAVMLSPL